MRGVGFHLLAVAMANFGVNLQQVERRFVRRGLAQPNLLGGLPSPKVFSSGDTAELCSRWEIEAHARLSPNKNSLTSICLRFVSTVVLNGIYHY